MFRKAPKPPDSPPLWLIVGLGNPGPEYRGTRHNIGFDVIDLLAKRARVKLDKSRQRALMTPANLGGTSVWLVKPMTFMNLSGQSVAPLAKSAGLPPDRVLVLADDLDLPVGKVRYRVKGSAGGHNGHKSIIQALGTQEYPRFKIGIGRGVQTLDHVLNKFHPDERVSVDQAVELAADAIEALLNSGEPAALALLAQQKATD